MYAFSVVVRNNAHEECQRKFRSDARAVLMQEMLPEFHVIPEAVDVGAGREVVQCVLPGDLHKDVAALKFLEQATPEFKSVVALIAHHAIASFVYVWTNPFGNNIQ